MYAQIVTNMVVEKKTLVGAFLFFCLSIFLVNTGLAQTIYVTPSDSIQDALDNAHPGDVIELSSGDYYEDFDTVRDGAKNSPITIKGPKSAVIRGDYSGHTFDINHDYITIEGITFNGLIGDPDSKSSYQDKLVYVQGKEVRKGVEGLKIKNVDFLNSGGEALRLRYFAKNNEISYCNFKNVGVHDFKFNDGGKNGEAIYLGTSSNQWNDGKNPTPEPDESTNNWIHHNYFDTQGNEAVDIKEGSYDNLVEYNTVTGQKDPNSGGLDSRGDENIFRYNEIFNNIGAGIRIGGHNVGGVQYGKNNYIYGNKIYDNIYGAVKVMTNPQKDICDNIVYGNGENYGNYFFDLILNCNFQVENPIIEDPITPDPVPLPQGSIINVVSAIATSFDERDGGHTPDNTLDNNLDTRWSAEGDGENIILELEEKTNVQEIGIAFYKGDQRIQYFSIEVSDDGENYHTVYEGESSGKSLDEQIFSVNSEAKYIRIIGQCNNENEWNSISEVNVYSDNGSNNQDIIVSDVSASSYDERDGGHSASNTRDNDYNTRWSAQGDGESITLELVENMWVSEIAIAFYKGDQRIQYFSIEVSENGINWTKIFDGQSSGNSIEEQFFAINLKAKYVRIYGQCNSENEWNSLTEINVY